ncbi:MAG: hypothetical protein U0M06_04280 [Clostridia bacterium]|nr:hypothetical protein [Clostridia bacterium]
MKKILSLVIAAAMLFAFFAVAVNAGSSPVGTITKVEEAKVTIVDGEGNKVELPAPGEDDGDGEIIEVSHIDDAHYVPESFEEIIEEFSEMMESEEFEEAFGDIEPSEFKPYGEFKIVLTDYAEKIVGDNQLVAEVTIHVPGMTAANNPFVYYYEMATGEYRFIPSKIEGSKITFEMMPFSAARDIARAFRVKTLSATPILTSAPAAADPSVGYYGIAYTGTITSPDTGVPTALFAAVLVVALAGAAFAGKKVFAK